jgi:hypothetical protein
VRELGKDLDDFLRWVLRSIVEQGSGERFIGASVVNVMLPSRQLSAEW